MNAKALYDSLHPLEIHLLAALFSESTSLSDEKLVELTPLDPSQISMALGWLQAKNFIQIESETSTFLAFQECFSLIAIVEFLFVDLVILPQVTRRVAKMLSFE